MAAISQFIVGRQQEIHQFNSLLDGQTPYWVLNVYGPGGSARAGATGHRQGGRTQPRRNQEMPALLRPRDTPDQHYTLELWTQSPTTRLAILDTITRHLGFTPAVETRQLLSQPVPTVTPMKHPQPVREAPPWSP
jgi:hypothetical protein